MEEFSASLYNNMIVFGKYPSQEELDTVGADFVGALIVVDLTADGEITSGMYDSPRVRFPIKDRRAVEPHRYPELRDLVVFLSQKVLSGRRIYIHCRGGHGRSGMIAALVYKRVTKCTGEEALKMVYDAHQQRTVMKPKFRKLGCPQTAAQKRLVMIF